VKKQQILHICVCVCVRARVRACSLTYPACNGYAPYCDVICGPSGSTAFFAIFHKLRNFRKKVIEPTTWVLIFSTTFV
jgi:hypothetical protein